jgi:hypothetical protein
VKTAQFFRRVPVRPLPVARPALGIRIVISISSAPVVRDDG